MNKEEAKALLPIITAMIGGKTIQVKYAGEWSDISDPSFTVPPEFYRVKPEPREWNLGVNEHGTLFLVSVDKDSVSGLKPILVREVLED